MDGTVWFGWLEFAPVVIAAVIVVRHVRGERRAAAADGD
jgi:hypothetical protein